MPEIGEIKFGKDIGFSLKSDKYIWYPCIDCLQPRWIRMIKGQPIHIRCRSCFDKISGKLSGFSELGKGNPAWRGGKVEKSGYIYVHMPSHPRTTQTGYVRRAILVLEKKIKRPLMPREQVHHINGNKTDDRPSNLIPMMIGDHTSLHHKGKHLARKVKAGIK